MLWKLLLGYLPWAPSRWEFAVFSRRVKCVVLSSSSSPYCWYHYYCFGKIHLLRSNSGNRAAAMWLRSAFLVFNNDSMDDNNSNNDDHDHDGDHDHAHGGDDDDNNLAAALKH
jgi:hypothetical protein